MTFYLEGSPRAAAHGLLEYMRQLGIVTESPTERARRLLKEAADIDHVCHGGNPTDQWYLLSAETEWIPAAVPTFMVAIGDLGG